MQTTNKFKIISKNKRIFIYFMVAAIVFIEGTFMAVDWIVFFTGIQTTYSMIMKPVVSFICGIIVFLIGKNAIDNKDRKYLALAFCFIIPVDILMSVVVYLGGERGLIAFIIGGILSIIAHFVLIYRHGRGFNYLKSKERSFISKIYPLVIIYLIIIVIFIPLIEPFQRVGHLEIAAAYAAFLGISTWLAWETIRNKLYPRLNAWLIMIGISCWLVTEIVGAIYNIQIGTISNMVFPIIWGFYGTAITCLALSGYRWKEL
jgi:hypothetical protein